LRGGLARLRTQQAKLHLLRWIVSLTGATALFWCYPRMPLADVYAIIFTAPLLITALSVPLLGERVGWRRWCAVLIGFAGVLVILDPGQGLLSALALLALFAAVMHALNMILVRKLGAAREPVEMLGLFGNGLTLILMALVQPWIWQTPTPFELALAALAGCIAGSGFLLLATAFRLAPAATIAPFQYSQMLYGVAAGFLLFDERPEPHVLVGAAIIIASGLYVLSRSTPQR
jgi:drug/metabolite transporter (DMT)-like permease